MEADLSQLADRPFDLLQAMDARLRGGRLTTGVVQQSWTGLRFTMAGHVLLAPQQDVREILNPPAFSRVPNAQPWLRGLANVRGNLLPIIDLRAFLTGESSSIGTNSRVLVLDSDDTPAGFLVDEVAGFHGFTAQEQRQDQVKSDANESLSPYLLGAFVRDGETLFVFSFAKLAASTKFQKAAA